MKQNNPKSIKTDKPKEVVYVWHYLEWGGAQVYFLGIASRIKGRVAVRFILPARTNPQFLEFCRERGIAYDFVDAVTDNGEATTIRRKFERHWRKLRSERATLAFILGQGIPDVVHIEFSPWQSFLALASLCLRTNVFVTMHNALPIVGPFRRLLWKLKFGLITRFSRFNLFASNEDAKRSLAPFVPATFLDKVRVTYTNVNPEEIDAARRCQPNREMLLSRAGLPANRRLVFCLGQFIDRKGRWTFLDAAKQTVASRPDVAFVWVTNLMPDESDRARIDSYGLGDVFFLVESTAAGRTHEELMSFLRLADVFALPSFVEGLPISLLEAMALGIASVSTRVYAIPEAVIDGQTGLLVEPGDSAGLAVAIGRLLDDHSLRDRLAANGRERVLNNFSEERVAEIAFRAYCDAFSENRR